MNLKRRIIQLFKSSEAGYNILLSVFYARQLRKIMKKPIKDIPDEVRADTIANTWGKYYDIDPKWAQYYYTVNGIASPYYVPSAVWFGRICRKLNRLTLFNYPAFQDKNYLDVFFADSVLCPKVFIRNINGELLDSKFNSLSFKESVDICLQQDEVIIKPSVESKHARNITFIAKTNDIERDRINLENCFREMKSDFIVQSVLKQHSRMAALNPDSINTIRVLSLLWNGQVQILGALVRIGVKGIRVDNPAASNGVSCVIAGNGTFTKFAYDKEWEPRTELPNGIILEGYSIPSYFKIIEKVKSLHLKVPHARLIGWDMSVSEEGEPMLIEANLDYPEIYFHQLGDGPVFKDKALFDEILGYVTDN